MRRADARASLWIKQGLDPKRIMVLMGHSSIKMMLLRAN
jgi:hypothetical protein